MSGGLGKYPHPRFQRERERSLGGPVRLCAALHYRHDSADGRADGNTDGEIVHRGA